MTFFYVYTHDKSYIKQKGDSIVYFIVVIISIWIGFRPDLDIFGDTKIYSGFYYTINYNEGVFSSEPIFRNLMLFFNIFGFSVNVFYVFVSLLYTLFPLLYCRSIGYVNLWLYFLFIVSSFSYLGYGINGIRNGLALSVLIFAFSFVSSTRIKTLLPFIFFSLMALGIHKTTMLPFLCSMVSLFLVKDIKISILIWIFSIPLSYILGNFFIYIFSSLGFDDRLSGYLLDFESLTAKGFRWDFILYSLAPIVLAYYVRFKRKVQDFRYLFLINTYILSNTFWILVIRASFSNRFAYLSWFLYPLVIAYPILKFRLWKKQNTKVALILLLYFVFTYLMWLRK